MKKIVWEKIGAGNDDAPIGHIYVTTISPKVYSELSAKGMTDDEICSALIQDMLLRNQVPAGGVHRANIIDADLPDNNGSAMEYVLDESTETVSQVACADQRRCYRDTWRWNGSALVEDSDMVLETKKEKVRKVRNKLLELSDKDELKLLGAGGQNLNDMRTYRQELRDLGGFIDADPDNITWPTKPNV